MPAAGNGQRRRLRDLVQESISFMMRSATRSCLASLAMRAAVPSELRSSKDVIKSNARCGRSFFRAVSNAESNIRSSSASAADSSSVYSTAADLSVFALARRHKYCCRRTNVRSMAPVGLVGRIGIKK